MNFERKPGIRRPVAGVSAGRWQQWILVGFTSLACAASFAAELGDSKPQQARLNVEKWIETQRVISQEKRDLALAREMLNERIALVQREIDSLRGKISEAETSIADADKKRAEMVEENEKLKQASASLTGTLNTMEGKVRHLLSRLPDPIRERIKPLSQRLPLDSEQTKQSVAERFQNIVGILNEIDKFGREISMTSEVRTLEDGSAVEVAAMYMGLGQAYYVSASGKVAGVGSVAGDAWTWRPYNQAAEQIAAAIAILKNEKPASFVHLPITIE